MRTFRVLVVDDHKAWRDLIIEAITQIQGMVVIGEVADGLSAVEQAKRLSPDLITMDIRLPHLNGIEVCKQIRAHSPNSKILCISENRLPEIIEEAFRVGATGYVLKSAAATDLLPALKAVLQGKQFVSGSLGIV